MRQLFKTSFMVALVIVCVETATQAAVPRVIEYQGRLTNAAGQVVSDGNYLLRFIIYDAPSGGNVLWDNNYRTVSVTGGLFTYALGDSTALPSTLFATDTTRWLGIKIGVDPELTPRVRFTSSAFAYKAQRADTAGLATSIPDGSVTALQLANDAVTGAKVQDGTISFADLGQNGATSGQVMKWSGSAWSAENDSVAATTEWTKSGTRVSLKSDLDSVGIGTATPNAKLDVNGDIGATSLHIGTTDLSTKYAQLWIRKTFSPTDGNYGAYLNFTQTGAGNVTGTWESARSTGGGNATGIYVQASADGPTRTGASIYALPATGGLMTGESYGLDAWAEEGAIGYGVTGHSVSASNNTGVRGEARGGSLATGVAGWADASTDTAYGVFGSATGEGVNWAGYFEGKVKMDSLYMPTDASVARVLVSDAIGKGTWQQVTGPSIADNSITASKIAPASVGFSDLSNSGVTQARLVGPASPILILGTRGLMEVTGAPDSFRLRSTAAGSMDCFVELYNQSTNTWTYFDSTLTPPGSRVFSGLSSNPGTIVRVTLSDSPSGLLATWKGIYRNNYFTGTWESTNP